jgi:hypothetical protein
MRTRDSRHNREGRKEAETKAQRKADQIFTTPSAEYASNPVYSERVRAVVDNEETGRQERAEFSTILQFRIKPDSFDVGPSTLVEENIDAMTPDAEIEWFSRRHGSHLLYGILVRCETTS